MMEMTFDGEILILKTVSGPSPFYYLHCPNKEVNIYVEDISDFFKEKKKRRVGFSAAKGTYLEDIYAWESKNHVHIGCLKETKEEFKKKYIELIKYLNTIKTTQNG